MDGTLVSVPGYPDEKAYVLVAGGALIIVGTLVEDVFTVGAGTADDPASAAAIELIRQGAKLCPVKLAA